MYDAALVRCRQTVGDLSTDLYGLANGQGAMVQPLTQGFAFQQLHNQVRSAILHTDVIDGEDVGMVQRRDAARLLLETVHPLGVGGDGLGQHLDGNGAVQPRVASAVHLAHAALADGRDDFVGAKFVVCGQCHWQLQKLYDEARPAGLIVKVGGAPSWINLHCGWFDEAMWLRENEGGAARAGGVPSAKVGLWRRWERASMAWKRSSVRSRPGPPSNSMI